MRFLIAVSSLLLAVAVPGQPSSAQSPSPDREYVEDIRQKLGREVDHLRGQDFHQQGKELIAPIAAGAKMRYPLQLIEGMTYALIAVCDRDCDHVHLSLYDGNNAQLMQSPEKHPVVIINGTPTITGSYTAELEVPGCKTRTCHAGVVVARLGTPPDPAPPPAADSRAGNAVPVSVDVTPLDETRIALLQQELRRVGCDPGDIDGVWGDDTKAALAAFTEKSKSNVPTDRPTFGALDALSKTTGRVCQADAQDTQTTRPNPASCWTYTDCAKKCEKLYAYRGPIDVDHCIARHPCSKYPRGC